MILTIFFYCLIKIFCDASQLLKPKTKEFEIVMCTICHAILFNSFLFYLNWYGNYVPCTNYVCTFYCPTMYVREMLNFKWQCCSISYLHYIYVHSFASVMRVTSPIKHINLTHTKKMCHKYKRIFRFYLSKQNIFNLYFSESR